MRNLLIFLMGCMIATPSMAMHCGDETEPGNLGSSIRSMPQFINKYNALRDEMINSDNPFIRQAAYLVRSGDEFIHYPGRPLPKKALDTLANYKTAVELLAEGNPDDIGRFVTYFHGQQVMPREGGVLGEIRNYLLLSKIHPDDREELADALFNSSDKYRGSWIGTRRRAYATTDEEGRLDWHIEHYRGYLPAQEWLNPVFPSLKSAAFIAASEQLNGVDRIIEGYLEASKSLW